MISSKWNLVAIFLVKLFCMLKRALLTYLVGIVTLSHGVISDEKYNALTRWLNKHKVDTSAMEIGTDSNSLRGLIATRDISIGEIFYDIPPQFYIKREDIENECIICKEPVFVRAKLLFKDVAKQYNLDMAAFLMEEYHLNFLSKWHYYIDTLPDNFDHLPRNYKGEDLEVLQKHIRMSFDNTNNLDRFCASFCARVASELRKINCELFKRFAFVETTRSFESPTDAESSILVPLADMANHDERNENTLWDFSVEGNFQFVAKHDIKKGEAIMIVYRDDLVHEAAFNTYGFVPSSHGADSHFDGVLSQSFPIRLYENKTKIIDCFIEYQSPRQFHISVQVCMRDYFSGLWHHGLQNIMGTFQFYAQKSMDMILFKIVLMEAIQSELKKIPGNIIHLSESPSISQNQRNVYKLVLKNSRGHRKIISVIQHELNTIRSSDFQRMKLDLGRSRVMEKFPS